MKHYITLLSLFLSLSIYAQQPVSLSLAECRRLAVAHNEKVKKSENSLVASELQKQAAFTNYFPRVDLSATSVFLQDQEIMGMTLKLRGASIAGFSLTQPIYVGGKIYNGNNLAKRIGIRSGA